MFERVPKDDFLQWAAEREIDVDAGSTYRHLTPKRVSIEQRWAWKEHMTAFDAAMCLVRAFEPHERIYLWPCHPSLGVDRDDEGAMIFADALIPELVIAFDAGFKGAFLFGAAQRAELIRALAWIMEFGWCPLHDVYLIPDTASVLVRVDHHDLIYSSAAFIDRCHEFARCD